MPTFPSRVPYGTRGLKPYVVRTKVKIVCRVPYGTRGLKLEAYAIHDAIRGRVPYGTRGLKHKELNGLQGGTPSRPVRDAWIETCVAVPCTGLSGSRVPYGTRGLKHGLIIIYCRHF